MDQPFLTPRSWMGRTSGRPRRKIRNISTVQATMPRTEVSRSTSSSSESRSAWSWEGTTPDSVLRAKSFIATIFAPESPDAGKDGGGGFAGDGLVGDGFQEDFVGAFGAVGFDAKFLGFLNQRGKLRILRRERIHCQAQVEWRQTFFRRHEGLPELLSI